MLNFAKVCLCGAVALILAFGGAPAHAGLSTNCLATGGSAASLLVHVKDKKSKKKNHDQESGLTECTIQSAGSAGGCKNGKWTCEKLSSGKKCCGCVPTQDSTAKNWVDTQKEAEGRFSVGTDAVEPAQ
jgi:hypothetical protein